MPAASTPNDRESDKIPPRGTSSPVYTEEEKNKITQYIRDLQNDLIREFLSSHGLVKGGKKDELCDRVEWAISHGIINYSDLVSYLDGIAPNSKQHVIVYDGPSDEILQAWRDPEIAKTKLKEQQLIDQVDNSLPLILPVDLKISLVEYTPGRELKITAVERRDYKLRLEKKDFSEEDGGRTIEYKAYTPEVDRGIFIFTWNLVTNKADLRIAQLPKRSSYEVAEERFGRLLQPALNLGAFPKHDIRRSINKLQELAEKGNVVARPNGLKYLSAGGRQVDIKGPTNKDSVLGERSIDKSIINIRKHGMGHIGNFYWQPSGKIKRISDKEIHFVIIGKKSRVNFRKPTKKEIVDYVISRLREYSS